MSSTAVLRTPPTSTSYRSDYISLRPPRGGKEKDFRRQNSPSPTASISIQRVKSPPERSFGDSPSPSPLRKRVLFERGSNGQDDSDDDDEFSPTLNRLHSPFTSRCASPFLAAWATNGSYPKPVSQPVEDDEGLFLISNPTTTPTLTPTQPPISRDAGCTANFHTLTAGTPAFAKLIFSTPAQKGQAFPALSPLQSSRPRVPQTPAETEWHLGRQAQSMIKLSLGDEDQHQRYKTKHRATNISVKDMDSSPSPISRRRGRKRSLDGNGLTRAKGEIFETLTDTPVTTSFHIPEFPSVKHESSTPTFFGSPIKSSAGSCANPPLLSVTSTHGLAAVQSSSPSPKLTLGPIAKKYRPRDSGVGGLYDDEDDDDECGDAVGPLASRQPDNASYAMSSDDSGLVTPSFEPSTYSAWPRAAFTDGQQSNMDEFIIKTLAAGGAPPKDKKVMPGTPVKRTAFAHSRPWMSSSKVMPPPALPRESGPPRKSLPLSFPNLSQIQTSPDSDTSPSDRTFARRKMYGDVGKGRPTMPLSRGGATPKNDDTHMQLLMRRSSSGAFSSSSSSDGSALGTPTKLTVPQNRLTGIQTPALQAGKTALKRPTYNRHGTHEHGYRLLPRRSFGILPRSLTEYERPNKFETEFVTVDVLGTGEFGSALKVRHKQGNEQDVSAIKKSKRFEGVKHRQRLREEVDVLQHLALTGGPTGHPNVLKYIDSWEQDDMLYIHTELCELGNFGTFLSEYGTHFEALDEARVWKICAELSNGLKFIHGAGVIHLDLKPANIFVTGEGRFRIGDFGMASLWPRRAGDEGFEREGDREYLAAEVLQGRYGKEADIFSFGMIMLETAANIVVPDMGDDWHRLRENDFSAVDFGSGDSITHPRSAELVGLICQMMRSNPDDRFTIEQIYAHSVVQRAREAMARKLAVITANGQPAFGASPLGGEPEGFVEEVLQIKRSANTMDLSP